MWHAVFDGDYDYIKGIYSEQEYKQTFGHLSNDYQPRKRTFETRIAAENFMATQNTFARAQYAN